MDALSAKVEAIFTAALGLPDLDLTRTRVADLAPLAGAPLGRLDLTGCKDIADLSARRGMRLRQLFLEGTRAADLAPLREMFSLRAA